VTEGNQTRGGDGAAVVIKEVREATAAIGIALVTDTGKRTGTDVVKRMATEDTVAVGLMKAETEDMVIVTVTEKTGTETVDARGEMMRISQKEAWRRGIRGRGLTVTQVIILPRLHPLLDCRRRHRLGTVPVLNEGVATDSPRTQMNSMIPLDIEGITVDVLVMMKMASGNVVTLGVHLHLRSSILTFSNEMALLIILLRRPSPVYEAPPEEPYNPDEPKEDDSEARSVFVSQLAARLTARDLGYFFEDKLGEGTVMDSRIVTDRLSRRSKGQVLFYFGCSPPLTVES
jgi:hypothetical protein